MTGLELYCDYSTRTNEVYGDTTLTWKLRNPAKGAVATAGSLEVHLAADAGQTPLASTGDLPAHALAAGRFSLETGELQPGRRYVAKLTLSVASALPGGSGGSGASGSSGAGAAATTYTAEAGFLAGRWTDEGPGTWIAPVDPPVYYTPTNRGSALVEYHASYFRKSFTVQKRPAEARLFVCGLGAFEASLNGNKLGDHHLDPPQTHYSEAGTYTTLFRSGHVLRLGRNNGRGERRELALFHGPDRAKRHLHRRDLQCPEGHAGLGQPGVRRIVGGQLG